MGPLVPNTPELVSLFQILAVWLGWLFKPFWYLISYLHYKGSTTFIVSLYLHLNQHLLLSCCPWFSILPHIRIFASSGVEHLFIPFSLGCGLLGWWFMNRNAIHMVLTWSGKTTDKTGMWPWAKSARTGSCNEKQCRSSYFEGSTAPTQYTDDVSDNHHCFKTLSHGTVCYTPRANRFNSQSLPTSLLFHPNRMASCAQIVWHS